jgi:hypothetical protein
VPDPSRGHTHDRSIKKRGLLTSVAAPLIMNLGRDGGGLPTSLDDRPKADVPQHRQINSVRDDYLGESPPLFGFRRLSGLRRPDRELD